MRVCRLVRKPASSTSPRRRAQGSQLGHRHASDEDDNVGGTPSRRPQCRTAEQAIRRMSEEAPGDPGRHLVDALVSISPDRGRLPTDRRPTRRRKDSAVVVPLGCPLPAVSRSVRRFLTRSDPQSPSVFPTNAGFLGDFAESGTGSKLRGRPRLQASAINRCDGLRSSVPLQTRTPGGSHLLRSTGIQEVRLSLRLSTGLLRPLDHHHFPTNTGPCGQEALLGQPVCNLGRSALGRHRRVDVLRSAVPFHGRHGPPARRAVAVRDRS